MAMVCRKGNGYQDLLALEQLAMFKKKDQAKKILHTACILV
jgi:hypothetical protein